MIPTLYRPDDAVRIPAPVFDLVDDLVGAVPTWRLEDDPVFWELVRDGLAPVDVAAAALEVVPWLLERLVDDPVVEPRVQLHSTEVAAAPVIVEPTCRCAVVAPRTLHEPDAWEQADDCPVHPLVEVSDPSQVDDEPDVADVVDLPTRALRMVQRCYCTPHPCSCDEPGGNLYPARDDEPVRSVEDEPVTREACPDCGATGLEPCRPKNRPTGTPLPRWHTRRRRLADTGAGMGVVLLVVAVVAVLVALLAGWLSTAFAPVEDRLQPCPVPTAASCPDGPGGAR